MSELELALIHVGRDLDYPAPPDLTGAVRRRLAERPPRFAWLQRRTLVIALAVVAVALGAVMAVPQARSEILDWFGIGSVTVRSVDELPDVEKATGDLGVGEGVSLEAARERAPFRIRVPTIEGLDDPDVYFRASPPGGQVSFVYGSLEKPKLLITQVQSIGALEKLVSGATNVERVGVHGYPGIWIEGEQHVLFYPGAEDEAEPFRLVGNTLVFERRDDWVTVRIEADISKDEALRIARSMR